MLVALTVPVPVALSEAPEPTTIVAVVLVPLTSVENDGAPVVLQPTLVITPPVVVHSGVLLEPMADSAGVVLNVQAPLTVCALVSKAAAVPDASNADDGWKAAEPNAPPAAVVSAVRSTNVALDVAVTLAAVPVVF
jgi:hypothetical protein